MKISKYLFGILLLVFFSTSIFSATSGYKVSDMTYNKKADIIKEQLETAISDFFRKNGVHQKTTSFITTIFQECEQSAKDPFVKEACKKINFLSLGKISLSNITIADIKKIFQEHKKIKQYNREDAWDFCPKRGERDIIYPPCPVKGLLEYGFKGVDIWYTGDDYLLGKAIINYEGIESTDHAEYANKLRGIVIARKGDTHRQPAFQMKEIGSGIGKNNNIIYIKNIQGQIVLGIFEEFKDESNSQEYDDVWRYKTLAKEFTLQEDNKWKLTDCLETRINATDLDPDDVYYVGSDLFQTKPRGKYGSRDVYPAIKEKKLPLSQCENQIEIINLIE